MTPTNNKAHMFIKLHFWHENLTVSTMTVVDMAGYPLKAKATQKVPKNHLNAYTDKYSELNSQGINYLLYVFKDMIFKESQNDRQQVHQNSSSKILKEFTNLITTGTNKISFLQFSSEMFFQDQGQASSQATQRYETFISKHLSQIRMPLVKPSSKVYSLDQFPEHVSTGGVKQRKVIVHF